MHLNRGLPLHPTDLSPVKRKDKNPTPCFEGRQWAPHPLRLFPEKQVSSSKLGQGRHSDPSDRRGR